MHQSMTFCHDVTVMGQTLLPSHMMNKAETIIRVEWKVCVRLSEHHVQQGTVGTAMFYTEMQSYSFVKLMR